MKMKCLNYLLPVMLLLPAFAVQSCDDDDDNFSKNQANAVVTLKTNPDDNTFYMQLDDSTTVLPSNIKTSPVGKKEVRALVNLKFTKNRVSPYSREAYINWIDTIRTKDMAQSHGDENTKLYGNDPVEIVNHWSTCVEDGYLTLRFRTYYRNGSTHRLNLVKGDKPNEVVLYHDAAGDNSGFVRDGLMAFRLESFPESTGTPVEMTLKWKSYSGEKTLKFKYIPRK